MDVDSYFFKTLLILAIILILFVLFKTSRDSLFKTSTFYQKNTSTGTMDIDACLGKPVTECDISQCTFSNNNCKNIENTVYINKVNGPPMPVPVGIYHIITILKDNSNEKILCNILEPDTQNEQYNYPHIACSGFNGHSLNTYFYFKLTNKNGPQTLLSFIDKERKIYNISITDGSLKEKYDTNPENTLGTLDEDTLYFFGINILLKDRQVKRQIVLATDTGDKLTPNMEEKEITGMDSISIANVVIGGLINRENKNVTQSFNGLIEKIISNQNFNYESVSINKMKQISGFYGGEVVTNTKIYVNQIDIEVPSIIDVSVKVNENELELYWLKPERGSNNITSYLIVLNQLDMDNRQNDVRKIYVHNNDNSTNCHYTLRNMDYGIYEIGVVGINDVGPGLANKLKRVHVNKPVVENVKTSDSKSYVSCKQDGSFIVSDRCYSETPIQSNLDYSKYHILKSEIDRSDQPLYFKLKQ